MKYKRRMRKVRKVRKARHARLCLKDRYQMYESEKNNPDPNMTYEDWVKKITKRFDI
jgi:hypothetical protein